MSADASDARAFAETVAGVLDRLGGVAGEPWAPGVASSPRQPELSARLDEIGWLTLAGEQELLECAGLAGVELGRRLAPVREVDRLLGAAPMLGRLVRSLGTDQVALGHGGDALICRRVLRAEAVPSADGLEVARVLELGPALQLEAGAWPAKLASWTAASVGYLAGLGEGALELTTGYVRQRRAFGTTLAGLVPVQQLLAEAAMQVRGVRLLAAESPGIEALAHSGGAALDACTACHQVTGAVGFTLEYPLHRYTQRARALATWNDGLIEALLQPVASAR